MVKGNSVFMGYFKDPAMTAKVLDSDGWLHTGDIATLLPNGAIRLVDRIQEFKKLQHGEMISPLKLENIYVNTPIIDQICVDVNSNYSFLIAVVTLNLDKLKNFCEVNDLKVDENIHNSEDVQFAVFKQLERCAMTNNLSRVEMIQGVVISP